MNMKNYFLIPFLFVSYLALAVQVNKSMPKAVQGFIENKGQIHDQFNKPNRDVLYLLNTNGLNIQLKKTGFAYDTYVVEKKAKELSKSAKSELPQALTAQDSFEYTYKYHRVDIELVGANSNAQVFAEKSSSDYTNYYNVTYAEQGILNVRSFEKIILKNIYEGIDVEYVIDNGNFKYNFIVHPGADYTQIQLKYDGAPLTLAGNKLQFELAQGIMEERIPKSWYEDESRKTEAVTVSYKQVEKNVFGFDGIEQKANQTLVVDPTPNRLWGTYYGGSAEEAYGLSSAVDATGNIFLAAMTSGGINIATAGAHQSTYGGASHDFFLVMFNTSGTRQWGTYYGGSGNEFYPSCAVDATGNIYLAGITESTANISTLGSHQPITGGNLDAFLVKFNTSGVRQWGTYYGGSGIETVGVSCVIDATGNIFFAGVTESTTNISTPGSHQSIVGGSYDAFLVKFSSAGVRQWGSYYGGTGNEQYQVSCAVDGSGNIFFSGLTPSPTNIATVGSHQSTIGAGYDAFLVKFNTLGIRQWATYYGGNADEYIGVSCKSDASGNIFLAGITTSTTNIATTGAHQTAYGGAAGDAFLVKFNTSGVRQWGTYYGGAAAEFHGVSCALDAGGNLFLAGMTQSPAGISTTGSHQSTIGADYDAFLVKFNTSGIRQWGTYYGGNSIENYSPSCNIDASGNIYLAGITQSTTNISTSGSHQSLNGGGSDAFLVKFKECTGGTLGTMSTINAPSPTTVCSGVARTFSLSGTVTNAASYNWTVPAGWTIVSGQGTNSLIAIPSATGTLSVRAYNSCGDSSTTAATRSVTVTASPAKPSTISPAQGQLVNGVRTFCNGTSATFSVTNVSGNTYQWTTPSGWTGTGTASTTNTITRTVGTVSDTIRVIAVSTTTTCPSDTQKLFVRSFQIPTTPTSIIGNTIVCVGKQNTFRVDSVPYATSYTWTIPSGWGLSYGSNEKRDTISVLITPTVATGSLNVVARNFCGVSSSTSSPITTNTSVPSQPSTITGATTVCGNNLQMYSVTNVSGTRYRWVLPVDWSIQSGDSTNQITVLTGNTSGTISVYPFQAINSICEGTVRTLTVNVAVGPNNPGPISGDTTVCVSAGNSYSIATVPNATSYVWTLPAGAGWSGSSITNTINITTGTTTGNFVLKVRAANAGCSSLDTALTINVSPAIGALSAISGSTSVCANSTQQFSISKPSNATSYTWSLPSGWTFNGRQDSNVVNTLVGSSSGSSSISVTATNLGCIRAQSLSISVVASPSIPSSITGGNTACLGTAKIFSVTKTNGLTYTWLKGIIWSGNSDSSSISLTPTSIGTDTIKVFATAAGGCFSPTRTLAVTVSQPPAVPTQILGATTTCIGSTELFRVAKVTNASSYRWTYPIGWSGSATTADTFVYASVGSTSGALSVASVNNIGCASAVRNSNSVTVSTVTPSAPTTINGADAYCVSVAKTYSVPAVTGATGYLWSVPSGWAINSGQNTTSINVIPQANTGVVSVQTVQGGCKSNAIQAFSGNPRTKPTQSTITLSGTANPCVGTNVNLSCASVADADTYTWTVPTGWTITSGNGNTFISANVGSSSGNITVLPKNTGCDGTQSTRAVTVSAPPTVTGKIEGETYVKSNTIRKYYVSGVSGVTSYNWSVIGTGWSILSNANEDSVIVFSGKSGGAISVDLLNACGSTNRSKQVFAGVSSGLNDDRLFSAIKMYPVPAKDVLSLSFSLQKQANLQWQIVNMLGQVVLSGSTERLSGGTEHELPISISTIPSGVYQLNISDGNATESLKFSTNK
jgi:hypothetical protein